MPIEKQAFIEAVVSGDEKVILQGIEEKIDLSVLSETQTDGRRPPIEFVYYVNNYNLLYLLWQQGVVATSIEIEHLYEQFAHGILPAALYQQDENVLIKQLKQVKLDLTNAFSASKLILKTLSINRNEDKTEIVLLFKPFKYNQQIFTCCLEFTTERLIKIASHTELLFEKDELVSSIYFDEVHNPIDLRRIKFGKTVHEKTTIELELFFDFEYEGTPFPSETVVLSSKI
ncbi:MAG: hypothetical protein RL757_2095 [Bacteroidota bacterium]|jgi:hypothetical protein